MRIGFDLDKIFVDYPPFIPDKLIDKIYKKKSNGELLYRIPALPEQYLRKFFHFSIFRPQIKENIEMVKKIPRNHNKLFLISSRFSFLEKRTKSILKKYELDTLFDGMYFNFENKQPHIFKNEILSKLHLDVYIDDDLQLLQYLARYHKKTKFYWLTSYYKDNHAIQNIVPITKLAEIIKYTPYDTH